MRPACAHLRHPLPVPALGLRRQRLGAFGTKHIGGLIVDGGTGESIGRLKSRFGHADAVILPVDCVSHAALAEIKRLCRRWNKPYLPIRRSGLSAPARALENYADEGCSVRLSV